MIKKIRCVTKLKPSKRTGRNWVCAKYSSLKSNAIVLSKNFSTIGIGAGQPSRLDSCKIAIQKAKQFKIDKIRNSLAASDAFFPFEDGVKYFN